MKKLIALLLTCCLLISFAGCKSDKKAEEILPENPISDFEYTIGEETVSLNKYIGTSDTVVIPKKIDGKSVTYINIAAFAETPIKKVIIPDSVISIFEYAFLKCTLLEEVDFGNGIKDIQKEAFYGCTALKEVILPNGLEGLYEKAFSGCTSIKKVFIPKSLKVMQAETFYDCPITDLTIENGLTCLGSYASFWSAELENLIIPASIEKIDGNVFYDDIKKVTFLGDAPECEKKAFGDTTEIHYKKGTKGWNTTPLRDQYTFVEE